jgi:cell filamentation protein
VDISKPGIMFAHASQIPEAMSTFEHDVLARYTPCRFETHHEQAEAIAVVHAELVIIHPFREGNGRCARMLAVLMAAQAGLPVLDCGSLDGRGRARYFGAIRQAWAKQDYEPLTQIFEHVIERTLERERRGELPAGSPHGEHDA